MVAPHDQVNHIKCKTGTVHHLHRQKIIDLARLEFEHARSNIYKREVAKTRIFHEITENSDKYGNVRGIVNKTRNFDNGIMESSDKYGNVRGTLNKPISCVTDVASLS